MDRVFQIVITAAFAFILAAAASAQTTLSGRVTSVLDGKTFVFETDSGRLTGTLQYVDVPSPEQPLSRIVREHFERLVLGKTITFVSNGFSPTALVGKAYLNGLDLGQQLIRDGAAWHVPLARSGQEFDDARPYVGLEILAKGERRGIWSIENLTPPWEFRLLNDQTFPTANFVKTAAASGSGVEDVRNYKIMKASPDMWADVGGEPFARRNPTGQNFWGYDAARKVRNTSTPSIAQVIVDGRNALEIEARAIYFQGEIKPRMANTAFVLGLLAISREGAFSTDSQLAFIADESEILLGPGQRFWRRSPLSVEELMQYKISRSDLHRIADAKNLTIRLGKYSGAVSREMREAIKNLLEAVG